MINIFKKINHNKSFHYIFNRFELNNLLFKSICLNSIFFFKERLFFFFRFKCLLSRVNLKNICILTGKARSVRRAHSLSRLQLRKLGVFSNLIGVHKCKW